MYIMSVVDNHIVRTHVLPAYIMRAMRWASRTRAHPQRRSARVPVRIYRTQTHTHLLSIRSALRECRIIAGNALRVFRIINSIFKSSLQTNDYDDNGGGRDGRTLALIRNWSHANRMAMRKSSVSLTQCFASPVELRKTHSHSNTSMQSASSGRPFPRTRTPST